MANRKNLATGTVLTAPSPAISGNTLTLQIGEGELMPDVPFFVTAHEDGDIPTAVTAEILYVTARTGDVLTFTRAAKDTEAQSIAVGWRISNAIYAEDISQVINVRDYGAVGGNVGDDSDAFVLAVAEAEETGFPVYVPKGVYPFSSTVELTKTITFLGDGEESVLKSGDGLDDYIFTGNPESEDVRYRFSNLKIDGNVAGQEDGGGIIINGAVEGKYENLHFINCYNWGLVLAGFETLAFGHHNRVLNCLFDSTFVNPGLGGGIWMTSCDENLIIGSNFQYLGGSGTATPAMIKDNSGLQLIQNCVFVGSRGGTTNVRGIWLDSGDRSNVIGCVFDGVGGDNMFIKGVMHIVANCRFTFPGDQGTGYNSGIHMEFGASRNTIVGCQFDAADAGANGTRSYIRESDGDPGNNTIIGCVFNLSGVMTLNVGMLELKNGPLPVTQVIGCIPRSINNAAPPITVGTTAPTLPALNDLWVDTN